MRILTASGLLLLSCCLQAQMPVDKLIGEAQQSPTLEKNLRALTDEMGGHVPGTPSHGPRGAVGCGRPRGSAESIRLVVIMDER